MDLERMFNISPEEVLKISDHLPVWAEFGVTETSAAQPAQTAGLNGLPIR
jgi:hypothetical protein